MLRALYINQDCHRRLDSLYFKCQIINKLQVIKTLGFLTKILTLFVVIDSQFSKMTRSPCVLALEAVFCLFFLTRVCHVTSETLSRAGRSSNCPVIMNGCSIPGDLPFVYKELFTPACNKHDVCYYCVSRCAGFVISWAVFCFILFFTFFF